MVDFERLAIGLLGALIGAIVVCLLIGMDRDL
jgi:hypothetical protein